MRTAIRVFGAVSLLAALTACQGAYLMEVIQGFSPEVPTYIGTWVNAANNPHGGKIVLEGDSLAVFDKDTDPTPTDTFTLAVAVDWGGDDAHCFKITATNPPDPPSYLLIRVSGDNRTLEIEVSNTAYPAFIVTSDPTYKIFSRQ